jgi:FkbM family methyltransferase
MNLSLQLRRALKRMLVQPEVNAAARTLLSAPLLGRLLPPDQVARIPIVGKAPVDLPNGARFRLQTDGDDAIASLMYWRRSFLAYEPDTAHLFLKLLRSARTFVDVGANTGIYSLAAAVDDPARAVYAFEPFPAVYAYLVRNIALNGLANVHAFPIALSDFTGSIPFFIPSASAVFPFSASTAEGLVAQVDRIQVQATTLDRFVAEQGIDRLDLIKVDTETTEHQVLRGAADILRGHRPLVICEVLPFGKEAQLHAVLDSLDYRYFWIEGPRLTPMDKIIGDETLTHMNYLFVPSEKAAEVYER